MKIGEALNWVEGRLCRAGIEEAKLESEIILQEELRLNHAEIYLNWDKTFSFGVESSCSGVDPLGSCNNGAPSTKTLAGLRKVPTPINNINSFKDKIIKRANHIPLAYILGKTQFMGLDFLVDERVMIPRQETEILTESVLTLPPTPYTLYPVILDIGTGCGNIAVSLAKFIPDSKIYAVDISGEALEIARENAKRNGVPEEKISFLQGDLFEPFKNPPSSPFDKGGDEGNYLGFFKKIDIIVSNPPYIPSPEIKNLQKEIHFEPRIALDGGFDGLEFYRRIISESSLYLKKGGYLFLEIGFNQAKEVKDLISKNSNFEEPEIVKDYIGMDRVIWAQVKIK